MVLVIVILVILIFLVIRKEQHKKLLVNSTEFKESVKLVSEFFSLISSLKGKYITRSIKNDFRNRFNNVFLILSQEKYNKVISSNIQEFINVFKDLDKYVKEHNENFVAEELKKYEKFFDNIDGKKLDLQQRLAVVTDEDSNLVLAGAGSGKTLTIIAKVKYLVETKGVQPQEILLLSFTRKSSEEITERLEKIGVKIRAYTFHKLGLDIITNGNGFRPDISEDLTSIINNFFEETLKKDKQSMDKLLQYFAYYLNIPKELENFQNLGESYDFFRGIDYETFKGKIENSKVRKIMDEKTQKKETFRGERVKSLEELLIANFLYINGVDYIYEVKYPFEPEDKYKKTYRPDFYLPEYDIYLEHFGINENNRAPWLSSIEEKKYLQSIEWKRAFHLKNRTKLLETYSFDNKNGKLLNRLEKLLKDNKVEFSPIDSAQIYKDIFNNENNQFREFRKLIASFINLYKANNYSLKDFDTVINKAKKSNNEYMIKRNLSFLDILKPILVEYENFLYANNSIDFNDMINKATKEIKENLSTLPYKYVLIDEFQDISFSRYSLIKEIIDLTKAKVICVGDDWQSIYRFTGSDIEIFTNFQKYFGEYELLKIENTYRNSQELINASGNFIMKNGKQFKKTLKSNKKHSSPLRFIAYQNNIYEKLINVIEEIQSINPLGKILILGRNNFDIDYIFNYLEENNQILQLHRQGDLVKLKHKKYPMLDISFMTAHKSKGIEADNVILINLENRLTGFPNKIADDPVLSLVLNDMDGYNFAEERRLFYVALTRTKNITYLLIPAINESMFTEELRKDLGVEIYKYDKANQKINEPTCPVCIKGKLTIRRNSFDNKEFLGCNNYPMCDYTYKSIELLEHQIKCPHCGGYMVKRQGKQGEFYGCTNYPSCYMTIDC